MPRSGAQTLEETLSIENFPVMPSAKIPFIQQRTREVCLVPGAKEKIQD